MKCRALFLKVSNYILRFLYGINASVPLYFFLMQVFILKLREALENFCIRFHIIRTVSQRCFPKLDG